MTHEIILNSNFGVHNKVLLKHTHTYTRTQQHSIAIATWVIKYYCSAVCRKRLPIPVMGSDEGLI